MDQTAFLILKLRERLFLGGWGREGEVQRGISSVVGILGEKKRFLSP